MDVLLIELVLWSGLLAFIWGLKEGLGKVEADIEDSKSVRRHRGAFKARPEIAVPDQRRDIIGRYLNHDIYRFIVVQGEEYEFERVCPPCTKSKAGGDELYVSPGLIYRFAPNGVVTNKAL